jgi:hypothetical protein
MSKAESIVVTLVDSRREEQPRVMIHLEALVAIMAKTRRVGLAACYIYTLFRRPLGHEPGGTWLCSPYAVSSHELASRNTWSRNMYQRQRVCEANTIDAKH